MTAGISEQVKPHVSCCSLLYVGRHGCKPPRSSLLIVNLSSQGTKVRPAAGWWGLSSLPVPLLRTPPPKEEERGREASSSGGVTRFIRLNSPSYSRSHRICCVRKQLLIKCSHNMTALKKPGQGSKFIPFVSVLPEYSQT